MNAKYFLLLLIVLLGGLTEGCVVPENDITLTVVNESSNRILVCFTHTKDNSIPRCLEYMVPVDAKLFEDGVIDGRLGLGEILYSAGNSYLDNFVENKDFPMFERFCQSVKIGKSITYESYYLEPQGKVNFTVSYLTARPHEHMSSLLRVTVINQRELENYSRGELLAADTVAWEKSYLYGHLLPKHPNGSPIILQEGKCELRYRAANDTELIIHNQ